VLTEGEIGYCVRITTLLNSRDATIEQLHALMMRQAETIAMLTDRLAQIEPEEPSKPRGTL
jgi:hypothetical protein